MKDLQLFFVILCHEIKRELKSMSIQALHYFFFFFRMPIVKILSKRRRKRDDFSEFGDNDFFEGVDFQIQKSDPSIQYYPSPYCNLVESKPQSNFFVENFININLFFII